MRFIPDASLGAVLASVHSAREIIPWFGHIAVTTGEAVRLLERWEVRSFVRPLPLQYAGILSPQLLGRARFLMIADHVPSCGRKLVQLHEAGHLYQGSAEMGITYDNDDWRTEVEQEADLFAAVGLLPTRWVDSAIEACLTSWEREDTVAGHLMDFAEGIWCEERARHVACNRLLLRDRLGV